MYYRIQTDRPFASSKSTLFGAGRAGMIYDLPEHPSQLLYTPGNHKLSKCNRDHLPINPIPITGEEKEIANQERCPLSAKAGYLGESIDLALGGFWQQIRDGAPLNRALSGLLDDQLFQSLFDHIVESRYIQQIQIHDKCTYVHILNVTAISMAFAQELGFYKNSIREIGMAALLHDLGKLFIPGEIMFKPRRLTEEEFETIKLHVGLSYRIIRYELGFPEHIARPALEHHENFGGGGYPFSLQGDEIHPYSQVIKIADVYDALTTERPYKAAMSSQRALAEMGHMGAKHFNPIYLKAFILFARGSPIPPGAY